MALSVTLPFNGGLPYKLEATDTVFTTGSFTPANNSLLVPVWLIQNDSGSTAPAPSWSNSLALTRTDLISADNGATDYSCAAFAHSYEIGTGASMTLSANTPAQVFGNIYVYPFQITGHVVGSALGAIASGVSGVTNGAFNLTLSGAPATDSVVIEAMIGALVSGLGLIDQAADFTETFDGGRTDWNKHNISTRTGSASTAAGWADVSNDSSPVSWYHNPVGIAFEIKAAGSGISVAWVRA
jgi:hypothetical protein